MVKKCGAYYWIILIWRVGNMGYSSREDNVLHFLSAFETVLKHQGYQFEGGSGSTHALAEYLN